jgi:hypothetical protein
VRVKDRCLPRATGTQQKKTRRGEAPQWGREEQRRAQGAGEGSAERMTHSTEGAPSAFHPITLCSKHKKKQNREEKRRPKMLRPLPTGGRCASKMKYRLQRKYDALCAGVFRARLLGGVAPERWFGLCRGQCASGVREKGERGARVAAAVLPQGSTERARVRKGSGCGRREIWPERRFSPSR